MKIKTCIRCGKEFSNFSYKARWCATCRQELSVCPKCGGPKAADSRVCNKCKKDGTKRATILRTCEACNIEFLAKDSKTLKCPSCAAAALVCECGQPKDKKARYCRECRNTKYSHTRGKTYEQIMSPEKANLLRETKAFKFKESSKRVGKFRSKYEKDFADFLTENKILYEYEVRIQGLDKTWSKFVDFFLPSLKIYIETSGYIWAVNQEEKQAIFLSKILEIASLLPDYQFVIASEPTLVPRIREYFQGYTVLAGKEIKIISLYELRLLILELIKETTFADN